MTFGATQPPRVLHVVNHDQRRGAETVATALAAALDRQGVVNEVIALGPGPPETPPLGIQRLSDAASLSPRTVIGAVRALRRVIADHKPDVVIAHGGRSCLHAVLARSGRPLIWHRILEFPPLSPLQRYLWSMVAQRVAGAVAITDRLENELRRLGYRGPILRVPNVRSAEAFRSLSHDESRRRIQRAVGIGDVTGPLIGFVGHLVPQKDPLLAVEVFAHVATQRPDAHFLIAGDGPLGPEVRAAVEGTPNAGRIHILGHRDDVPELLSALDVLAITSRSESMAGVSIEASLAGCPVVTFEFDGVDGTVAHRESGLIVPTRAASDMAAAVLDFVSDPAALHQARRAARRIGTAFELEHHVPAYRDFIEKVRRPTRVMFLMPDIGVGGAEQSLAVIARHRTGRSIDMRVTTLRAPRRPPEETIISVLDRNAVPVTSLDVAGRGDRSPVALASAAWRLRRLCKREKIEIVDSCLFEADLTARLALLLTPTKHVVHLVNTPYSPALDGATPEHRRWRRRLVQWIDRSTAPLSDQYVAITTAVEHAARRDIAAQPVRVIPRGVELDRFRALPIPESTELSVLCVGRLVPQKGHDTAIRAVAAALRRGVDVRLTIHGEGPLRTSLLELAMSLGVEQHVSLPGPIRDVREAHREHQAFLFPSRWEGQGNALLEAMACARPVIVSDIPVLREVVGPVGRFVPPDCIELFAEELTSLAATGVEALQAEGQACRHWIEAHYSVDDRLQELIDLYRDLA